MTSVLIIDDHPIVLQGCRRVLEDAGLEPVLTASDIVAGYRLYRRHAPDVVVVDLAIQGKGLAGIDLIRRIRVHRPRAHILVLTMHNEAMIARRALEAGATGYLLKDTSSEQLVRAVQQIATGTPYLDSEVAMKVALTGAGSARGNPLSDLTPRELQVLALLADGKPYERIAGELNVSYKTVVNVSSQLKQKLRAGNLPELISTAVKLLAPPPRL
jgi:two-component system, NarL family, invasion response regulator UvrY